MEFCGLGIINTFNDSLFSSLASLVVHKNLATLIGYAIGLSIAFFLTCKIIFKHKPTFKRYYRFIVSYIPNFIIYYLVTFLTLNVLKLSQFWGTAFAAMAGGPITFVIIKIYAFGRKKEIEQIDENLTKSEKELE